MLAAAFSFLEKKQWMLNRVQSASERMQQASMEWLQGKLPMIASDVEYM